MEEIHEEVKDKNFNNKPLVCVMDGALYLWALFKAVFKDIENKVLILDIIHVLEYIWIIAHIKHKEGSAKGKKYVYNKSFPNGSEYYNSITRFVQILHSD